MLPRLRGLIKRQLGLPALCVFVFIYSESKVGGRKLGRKRVGGCDHKVPTNSPPLSSIFPAFGYTRIGQEGWRETNVILQRARRSAQPLAIVVIGFTKLTLPTSPLSRCRNNAHTSRLIPDAAQTFATQIFLGSLVCVFGLCVRVFTWMTPTTPLIHAFTCLHAAGVRA